jgi:hypothetical protein
MPFNAEKHLMNLSGKAYLEVKWRLVWFRLECPNGTIDTEEVDVDLDREVEAEIPTGNWIPDPNRPGRKMPEKTTRRARGYARFRAVVTDGKGGRATATKSENAASFPDYIEKAETGAVGRALAMLGYGTQFTGDELSEDYRIVDAPVDRTPTPTSTESNGASRKPVAAARPVATTAATNGNGKTNGSNGSADASTPATEQQLSSLRKLCQHLGKPEPEHPDTLTYLAAKELITQLSHEYNEQRQSRSKAS